MRRKRGAFTLVELLVVIAIISLLISIVLPAMGQARRRTRTALCAARLHSLGMGWAMYASESRERNLPHRLPTYRPGGFANPANCYGVSTGLKYRPRWPVLMQRQVGVPALNNPSVRTERQNYDSPAYICPEVPEWKDERNAPYGYNYQFLGSQRVNLGHERNPAVPVSRITHAAVTVVIADSAGTAASYPSGERQGYSGNGHDERNMGNCGWLLDPPRLLPGSSRAPGPGHRRSGPDPRHANKCDTLLADGHVTLFTPEQLGYGVISGGRMVDGGLEANNRMFSGTGKDDDPP